jgi:uncharacterized OsmC-like protein
MYHAKLDDGSYWVHLTLDESGWEIVDARVDVRGKHACETPATFVEPGLDHVAIRVRKVRP